MTNEPPSLIEIAAPGGPVPEPQWLARCEAVHRELRPQLPPDYIARMQRIIETGAGMVAAAQADEVIGLAVYRVIENTFEGRKLYVDDLVTAAARRSAGVGAGLLDWLHGRAADTGCRVVGLDSGTQRGDAHRFYFREGFTIASYSFRKSVAS